MANESGPTPKAEGRPLPPKIKVPKSATLKWVTTVSAICGGLLLVLWLASAPSPSSSPRTEIPEPSFSSTAAPQATHTEQPSAPDTLPLTVKELGAGLRSFDSEGASFRVRFPGDWKIATPPGQILLTKSSTPTTCQAVIAKTEKYHTMDVFDDERLGIETSFGAGARGAAEAAGGEKPTTAVEVTPIFGNKTKPTKYAYRAAITISGSSFKQRVLALGVVDRRNTGTFRLFCVQQNDNQPAMDQLAAAATSYVALN
jgi:hypothetical protein